MFAMGPLKSESVMCPVDKHCSEWAKEYMGYCLCSKRDGISLALGLISVVSWVVAEIPQIITNYKQKSAEGLSIVFLLTWIVGDFFNVFGCILEPATLPTQYYTAVLYTATTLILTMQAVYYRHIYPRLKFNKRTTIAKPILNPRPQHKGLQGGPAERKTEHNNGVDTEEVNNVERCGVEPSSPIPLAASSPNSSPEELYFMSARSLSVSHTPPVGSCLAQRTPTSDLERQWLQEPLLGEIRSSQSASPPKLKTMLCLVSLMTFFLGSSNHHLAETHTNNMIGSPTGGIVLQVGRRLFQAKESRGSAQETLAAESSGIGSFLGWGMAAIYLGGRLPQIFLNIRRGNAEGLNPLMFVFAVIGNATYVASILVSSLDWLNIKPNLPWLVDTGGCVLLDTFILIQYIYYRHRLKREEVEKYVN